MAAAIQCTEALKFLSGNRQAMRRTLLSWDLWSNQQSEVEPGERRADCRACGRREFIYLNSVSQPAVTLCGRHSVQIRERAGAVDFGELSRRLNSHGRVRHNEFVLKFWLDPYELTVFPDGRAIIKGTDDTAVARSLYARFIGS
jgi:adenylyltransferase/sulfurtransferase